MTRRVFLIGAGAAVLAACTSDSSSGDSTTETSATSSSPTTAAAPTRYLSLLTPPNSILNQHLERASKELGIPLRVEVYGDPAFVLDRLHAQQGTYQYDIIIVPGAFLPAAIDGDLLLRIDKSKIPSFSDLVPRAVQSPFDPESTYSIVKEVRYTGYAWDKKVLGDGVGSWEEFLQAAARPGVSGKVTGLRDGAELIALPSWAKGKRTPRELDVAADLATVRERLTPHLLDLDSNASVRMQEGSVVLAQMWNGEGRNLAISDPDRWGYAIGSPVTGVFMERFVIPTGAPNPEQAHAFIEMMLQPDVSLAQAKERGYNTGVASIQDDIGTLPQPALIPTGEAMFGDARDYGESLLEVTEDELRAIVVAVAQQVDAPSTTVPTTAAPTVASSITTGPPNTEPDVTPPQTDSKGRRILRPQDSGPEVEQLQRRLIELGFSVGRVDGQYGDVTLAAVMAFQRSQGLQPDGVVGPLTHDALENPKPILSRDVNTRGVPENSPSDASGSAPTQAPSTAPGKWTKAIIYLDSFRDEFFDADGKLVAAFPMSPGVNGLTPVGTFKVYSRSARTFYQPNPAETMQWMVRFNGGVGFHSIPRINGVPVPTPLGQAASSHGCIRHADADAKRIYDNLVTGATVIVRHG